MKAPLRTAIGRRLFVAGCAVIVLAWLAPNHYPPWLAFHSDALAACAAVLWTAAALLALAQERAGFAPAVSIVPFVAAALAAVPCAQAVAGLIQFAGDACIVSLYLLGFALCIWAGESSRRADGFDGACTALAGAFVVGALASAWIALAQWLGLYGSLWLADLPPRARLYANLAQPNQLATLLNCALAFVGWLRATGRLGRGTALLVGVVLVFVLCGTQSRAGWLGFAAIAAFGLHDAWRRRNRADAAAALLLIVVFLAGVSGWNALNDALLLADHRLDVDDRLQAGTRPLHWKAISAAIAQRPWFGFGWNQVTTAQQATAFALPASGEWIAHSHNLLLDLMAWNGVPIGAAAFACIAAWFVRLRRLFLRHDAGWVMTALAAVLIHALLEFPLEYAYFLLPVGWLVGWMSVEGGLRPSLRVPRTAVTAAALALTVLLGLVVADYVRVESDLRQLRFAHARIGRATAEPPLPRLSVLTQLRAMLQAARLQPRAGMPEPQLDLLRRVSARFGSASDLYRYALASGLNGRQGDAERALATICKTQPPAICDQVRAEWRTRVAEAPALAAIVFPPSPSPPRPEATAR